MGNATGPGLLEFFFGSVFLTAGIVNQIAFWLEIEPLLRRLGHRYDAISLRKYKNGFLIRSLNINDHRLPKRNR